MKIKEYQNSDLEQCAKLITKTFSKYNKNEGSKKAVKEYLSYFDIKNNEEVKNNFSKSKIFFVAVDNKIIGLIRGNNNRISNFFVDEKYHGKGIGRLLIENFEKQAKKLKSKQINVRASLFSIPIYKKLGYKKTTGIRLMKMKKYKLKFQPMEKKLR